jgi:hypothetical protein
MADFYKNLVALNPNTEIFLMGSKENNAHITCFPE